MQNTKTKDSRRRLNTISKKARASSNNNKEMAGSSKKGIFSAKKDKPGAVPSVSFYKLFRFADRKDKVYIFLGIIFSIISGSCITAKTIFFANILQELVNYGISLRSKAPASEELLEAGRKFTGWMCFFGSVLMVLSYGATVLMNIAAYRQVYRIRQEYLKAALNQDFAYFDTHATGDFASKMSDDLIKLEDGIGEKVGILIFYLSVFLSSVIVALYRGWKLALLCLVTLPITTILVSLTGLVASKLSNAEVIATGEASAVAEEALTAVRTVYAFGGQKKEIDRYQSRLGAARSINVKKGLFTGLSMSVMVLCIFSGYGFSFWIGYSFITNEPENYDVSTMMAVFICIMGATENFGMASTLMEVFGIACGAGTHIFALLDIKPTINPLKDEGMKPKSIEGNIEIRNVVFHYPARPDVPVLRGINMSVKQGQTVALVGHSGCGKSTIIQLLSRFYDVVEGNVIFDGNDVRKLSVRWLRAQIGLVGQEPVLFNTTVRENIRYGREDATPAEIEEAARQANAHQFIMKLSKGYDTIVGERGASLSGGQKQRIAIARALIRKPKILLLDEATSALDTASEAIVQKALDKAQEGRTTVVVAHRLTTIRHADVIYVFENGLIKEIGNHDQLMEKKGQYYDMVTVQTLTQSTENTHNKPSREASAATQREDDEEKVSIAEEEPKNETQVEEINMSLWEVLKLNSPEWKSITVACITAIVSGMSMPVVAIIFGDFLGILSNPDPDVARAEVRRISLLFVGLGVIAAFTNFINVYMYGLAGAYLTERLRRLMLEKLLQQEMAFFDDKNNSTGALCARLSGEAAAVQGATGRRIGTLLEAVSTLILSCILSLVHEWRVGLVALAFVPFIIVILSKEGKMMNAESFGTAKVMESSSKIAVEAVANFRTVASLGREQQVQKEYAVSLLPALKLAVKGAHWRGIIFGLSRGIFSFVNAATMYYGVHLIVNNDVSYEVVIKSSQALIMGASSVASAFVFAPNFQKGLRAAGRIVALLKRQSKITDPVKPVMENFKGTGEAIFHDVWFNYPTRPKTAVLKDFKLEIERGKTIALVGHSGCGKSTVIQLLERYYDPREGEVMLDGVPIPKLRISDVRSSMGLVQQEPILFDLTIGENIAYGDNSRKPDTEEIVEVAKQANIHNFVLTLPKGYETNIGSKGTQLSGGQKQRIAIARALIRKPNLLLLDEATSALDTESEKVVQEALDRAKAGRTCVMIAHRLSTVQNADTICVLSEGQVAERGTHSELMGLKGLYYKLNKSH